MLKRILVPLYGSGLAERALAYATSVAEVTSAEIVLLRVALSTRDARRPSWAAWPNPWWRRVRCRCWPSALATRSHENDWHLTVRENAFGHTVGQYSLQTRARGSHRHQIGSQLMRGADNLV
jgi:nucleotide-binding universal stress UspA family protein